MSHHLTDDVVRAFLDGLLDEDAAITAALHLDACATCTARIDQLDPFAATFAAMPQVTAPPDLAAAVLREAREPEPQTRVDLLVGFGLLSVAAVLVLFLGEPVNAVVRAGLLFDALGTAASKLAVAAHASQLAMVVTVATLAALSAAATRISVAVAPRRLT